PQVDSEVNMSELRHDVCGFDQPVSGGTVDSDGLVNIVANHPHLLYMGRIDCSTPLAPAFAYPGISIRARFEGDALDLKLEDFGGGTQQDTNYYDISIDGRAPTL